ncbi:MAG TPA: Ig-like domain-containing protein [Acidimicrobiales bacterium]|nr:Ig-like domain-containing protein [Acidimicrobiales bacterium]
MRRPTVLAAVVLVVASVGGVFAAPAASAATPDYNLFVGYADNLRSGTAQSPTPWAGSPGVFFAGCTPVDSCEFDGGAIRVANATAVTETVDYVTADFDGCVFDLWPHGVVLPAGGQLILAQTQSGSSNGCTVGTTTGPSTMDSSDFGPGGTPWAGVCSNSGVIPQVTVSVNGTATTYADIGQVLNTGGVDAADCDRPGFPAGSETTQWVSIGAPPCPTGAVLSLAPASQTAVVGSTAILQANLSSCSSPLQGAPVAFTVTSGPDAGVTGSGVTDGGGNATFTYAGTAAGTDTVVATVTNLAGTITSSNATVTWIATTMTGRAYGLASSGLVPIAPTPDTGPVSTTTAGSTTTPCVLSIPGAITAHNLCAKVTTTLNPASSTATASVSDVRVGLPGLPVIAVGAVQSTSKTTCSGSAGGAVITYLKIGGVTVVGNPVQPQPNATVSVLGVRVVLNEQAPVPGGLTVSGLHITALGLNLVVASATSDIHNCA